MYFFLFSELNNFCFMTVNIQNIPYKNKKKDYRESFSCFEEIRINYCLKVQKVSH